MVLFLWYPKCSTCKKAKKFLDDAGVAYTARDITTENPTAEELLKWIRQSGLEGKKFLNTSGRLYRERGLKDVVKTMSDTELAALLSEDGMLVKRPLLVLEDTILPGFKEEAYRKALGL